jgi:hypothetical protein
LTEGSNKIPDWWHYVQWRGCRKQPNWGAGQSQSADYGGGGG